jgi:uncharacterized protein (DUF1800 family)
MQLFTIGLYELKPNGRKKVLKGEFVATYENSDIQTFARAWTGFRCVDSKKSLLMMSFF